MLQSWSTRHRGACHCILLKSNPEEVCVLRLGLLGERTERKIRHKEAGGTPVGILASKQLARVQVLLTLQHVDCGRCGLARGPLSGNRTRTRILVSLVCSLLARRFGWIRFRCT